MLKRKQSSDETKKKSKLQAARQKRDIHDIIPDEFDEFDATLRNGRKTQEIPVEPATMCLEVSNLSAKAPMQKVAVSSTKREPPIFGLWMAFGKADRGSNKKIRTFCSHRRDQHHRYFISQSQSHRFFRVKGAPNQLLCFLDCGTSSSTL